MKLTALRDALERNFSLERLDRLFSRFRDAFWRHDVDFSLDAALKMAKFERERGVSATYYLFLDGKTCPFYSLDAALRAEKQLLELGHRVGQHVDERTLYTEWEDLYPLRELVSFHCPSGHVLWRDFPTFENAYSTLWRDRYLSDSGGRFRFGDPEDVIRPSLGADQYQVNLHAEWWVEKGWYHDVPDETYRNFFRSEKPKFVDSRRGRPVRNGEPDIWAFDPRPWASTCALWVSPEQYEFVMRRGYALIDGQKAVPQLDSCPLPSPRPSSST